jgi:hypothetical protein
VESKRRSQLVSIIICRFRSLAAHEKLGPYFPALNSIGRLSLFVILIAWYFSSAKSQAKYIRERFGDSYPRKGWLKPIIITILILFLGGAVIGVVGRALVIMAGN